jgi:hypothetical protein
MGWLDKIFKEPKGSSDANELESPSPSTSFHDLDGHPMPMSLKGADLGAARELVKTAAMQITQIYGIPTHWLSFEVVTIADDEKAFFQLQIMMNYWEEYLASHNYAFERAVLKRIRDEDADVGRAVRAVLWRASPDAGCPYDDLPDGQAWTAQAITQRGLVRDRINREMPAALGALASGAAAAAVMPQRERTLDEERGGDSTLPVTYDHLEEPVGFHQSQSDGGVDFAETRADDFQSTHAIELTEDKPVKTS